MEKLAADVRFRISICSSAGGTRPTIAKTRPRTYPPTSFATQKESLRPREYRPINTAFLINAPETKAIRPVPTPSPPKTSPPILSGRKRIQRSPSATALIWRTRISGGTAESIGLYLPGTAGLKTEMIEILSSSKLWFLTRVHRCSHSQSLLVISLPI